jgi:putative PEP-CTERM system TPR-repeat lipoprotein
MIMTNWKMILWALALVSGAALSVEDKLLQEARAYLDKGEAKSAVIQLKNALLEAPENVEARLLLGEAYLKLGDGVSAAKELEKAADLKAPKERWAVSLARAYLLQNQAKKVLDSPKLDADSPAPLRAQLEALRGMAHLALDARDQARASFESALALDAGASDALLGLAMLELAQKNHKLAREHADRAIAKDPRSVGAWTLLGEAKRLDNDGQGAVEAFGRAIDIQPLDPRARLGRATAYLGLGKFDEAGKDIDEVRAKVGDLPMALYLHALVAYQGKQLQDAEDALLKVLNAMPNHPPSLLLLGTIAYQQNKLESAENYLSKFVGYVPDQLPALKMLGATRIKQGQTKEAISVLQPAADRHPDDPQLLAMLGSAYLKNQQFDQGTEHLSRAAELAPDLATVRAQLALGRIATGNMDQAVADLKTAVEIDPALIQADITLILALIQQKKFDEAIAAAGKLKEKKGQDPMADNLLGAAYMAKGDAERAREHWNKAIEIKPDYASARINLARLAQSRNQPDQAIKEYEAILKRDSKNLTALLGLAQIEEARGDLAKMAKRLEEARDKNPKALQPALMLTRYHLSRNKNLQALEIAQAAERDNPDQPQAVLNLAQAQLAAGQGDNAVANLRKLVAKAPDAHDYRHALAQALYKKGDKAEAAKEWETLRTQAPDYAPATIALAELAMQDKDYARVDKLAGELITKLPKAPVGLQLKGDALFAQKRTSEALKAYEQAYQIAKTQPLAQRLFRARLSLGNHDAAVDGMKSWLETAKEDAESWLLLALAYQERGNLKDAAATYEKVEALRTGNPVVLNNLAWVYQELGDPRALAIAEKIPITQDTNPEVVDTVGWIFLRHGKANKGLVLLQQAAVQAPHLIPIRIHLAEALIKTGKPEEGKKELQRLLKEKKDFPEKAKVEELLRGLP